MYKGNYSTDLARIVVLDGDGMLGSIKDNVQLGWDGCTKMSLKSCSGGEPSHICSNEKVGRRINGWFQINFKGHFWEGNWEFEEVRPRR